MKNIKYIFLLSLFFQASCTDEVEDLQPFVNGNPDTFFTDVQSFQFGVDGAYSQLRNYYISPGSGLQGIPDILSDNVVIVQTGRTSNEDYYDYRYVANTAGAIPLYWSEAYEAVNAANLVIGAIDNLAPSADRDNILGQALAVRALAHFDLVRVYAQIPTQSSGANATPGIIYIKVEDGDTDDPFALPARETVQSNYQEILDDMVMASQLISESNAEGRMDANAVFGFLSRIYLYTGQYQAAIDAANEVTAVPATADELPDVYTDVSQAGVLFELAINTTTERANNVGVLYSQSNATSTIVEYAVEFEFFNSIDDNDARKDVIQFVGTNLGNDYNAIEKFLGEPGQVDGFVDGKALRVAEVILNKAEAQFELGQETGALETLDELRNVRFSSFTSGETGQALEDAIQFNRRVELAFEGHRFFDLKRRGEPVVRSNNGDIIDGTGTSAEVLTLPVGDFRFQLPIPSGEINVNTNLEQNDGY